MKLTNEQIFELLKKCPETSSAVRLPKGWEIFARAIESAVREQVIEECAGVVDRVPLEYFATDSYINQTKRNQQMIFASIRALSEKSS